MRRDMVMIDETADERSENRRGVLTGEEIEPPILQIADAGREPEPNNGQRPNTWSVTPPVSV